MVTMIKMICAHRRQPIFWLVGALLDESGIGADTINVSKLYPQSQICALGWFQSLQFGQR